MKYRVRKDTVCDESAKTHAVYGIEAISAAGKRLRVIPDIFSDRQRTQRLVDLCNRENLPLIHLPDIVENALAGMYPPQ